MAKTFQQMVAEAREEIPMVSVEEAKQRMQQDPNTLIVDVRDDNAIKQTGIIPGAAAISYSTLPYKADNEVPEGWRDERLADRDRPIIMTCGVGAMASLGAKTLKDMGFTNVSILEGGTQGWKEAGNETQPHGE